ncbi:MAG: hypothetical protein ACOX1X_06190 [Dethiobacteria bacterium]
MWLGTATGPTAGTVLVAGNWCPADAANLRLAASTLAVPTAGTVLVVGPVGWLKHWPYHAT